MTSWATQRRSLRRCWAERQTETDVNTFHASSLFIPLNCLEGGEGVVAPADGIRTTNELWLTVTLSDLSYVLLCLVRLVVGPPKKEYIMMGFYRYLTLHRSVPLTAIITSFGIENSVIDFDDDFEYISQSYQRVAIVLASHLADWFHRNRRDRNGRMTTTS